MRRKKWIAIAAAGLGAGLVLCAVWFGGVAARIAEAQAATRYLAKAVCSCLYVEGRGAAGCKADALMDHARLARAGLGIDENDRSVTARLFFFVSAKAAYDEGYGCALK